MSSLSAALTRTRVRVLVAVVAVLVAIAATTGIWHEESESTGGPMTPVQQRSDAPRALWIGDSYTSGVGAHGPARGYPCLVSDRLGWTCHLDAQGGTGFVHDGSGANATYAPLKDRLSETRDAFQPDLVVVDAGRNDWRAPSAAMRRAVVGYLGRVRSAFPDTELVVVLPFLLGDSAIDYRPIDRIVRNAAAGVRATVIDTTSPAWKRLVERLPTIDGVHPTGESHTAIARRLMRDFRRLGIPAQIMTHQT